MLKSQICINTQNIKLINYVHHTLSYAKKKVLYKNYIVIKKLYEPYPFVFLWSQVFLCRSQSF